MKKNQTLPRVGIVNCVSQALEMLRFSSEQLIENAGTDNFDYVIVCWHTTPEVDAYILGLSRKYAKTHPRLQVIRIDHKEDVQIGFVPNLRAMINEGFDEVFKRDRYGGLVNTDQAFFKNWLVNLVKHCVPKRMVSVLAVMPNVVLLHRQADFGITEYGKFDLQGFFHFCESILQPECLITEEEIRREKNMDYLNLVGLPYIHSRELWEKVGPWELKITTGTPDVNFWKRAHKAGFEFAVSLDSIAYHTGGVERRAEKGVPPEFARYMEYEPISFWTKILIFTKIRFLKLLQKLGIKKGSTFV